MFCKREYYLCLVILNRLNDHRASKKLKNAKIFSNLQAYNFSNLQQNFSFYIYYLDIYILKCSTLKIVKNVMSLQIL